MKPINWQWKTEPLGRPKNVAEVNKGKRNIKTDTVYEKLIDKHALQIQTNQFCVIILSQEHGVNKIFKLETDRLDVGGNK